MKNFCDYLNKSIEDLPEVLQIFWYFLVGGLLAFITIVWVDPSYHKDVTSYVLTGLISSFMLFWLVVRIVFIIKNPLRSKRRYGDED